MPQGRRVFPSLTVKENLAIAERCSDTQRWDFAKIYSLFPHIEERRDQRAKTLSGGEQQMLAIARALISNPLFILMKGLIVYSSTPEQLWEDQEAKHRCLGA